MRFRSRVSPWVPLLVVVVGLWACQREMALRDLDGDGIIRIACLGDSNTDTGWPAPGRPRWCEIAAASSARWSAECGWPPLEFRNFGKGGATVTDPGIAWRWAGVQRDEARSWRADLVVAAFGTNDLRIPRPAAAALAGYRDLVRHLVPVPVLIALTPPFADASGSPAATVDELNRALRESFPASQLVDFHDGFDLSSLEDGVHLDAHAQEERAARVVRALRPMLERAYGRCPALVSSDAR